MSIPENLQSIHKRMAAAAQRAGRSIDDVQLITIGKTRPDDELRAAYAAGERAFGESRVQALAERTAVGFPPDLRWHLIGPLQKNKVRQAVRCASVIHSVESVALLQRIDRIAGEESRAPQLLIQVNVSGETAKQGIAPSELPALLEAAANLRHASVVGLMTMAPHDADETTLRSVFCGLRNLAQAAQCPLPHLSMGMSDDFEIAIEEGATLIRVGSAIFRN